MKKYLIIIFTILISIISLIYFFKIREFNNYKTVGNKIIEKVFLYKKINKELPNSISDFDSNKEMGEGPYYEKIDDTTFIVYFNIGFDDKIFYNSNDGEWKKN